MVFGRNMKMAQEMRYSCAVFSAGGKEKYGITGSNEMQKKCKDVYGRKNSGREA